MYEKISSVYILGTLLLIVLHMAQRDSTQTPGSTPNPKPQIQRPYKQAHAASVGNLVEEAIRSGQLSDHEAMYYKTGTK